MRREFSIIKTYIDNAIAGGILWIFGSSVFSQLCAFVSSVVVIRHLPKAFYGYYVDANNIYSYTAAFVGMGMASAIIQFCSEKRSIEEINAIYSYSLFKGLKFNFALCAIILSLAYFKHINSQTAAAYLAYMCFLPMFSYTNQFTQVALRVKRLNKEFGWVNMGYSISVVIGNILLTYMWGVVGLIVSGYLSNLIATLIGYKLLNSYGFTHDLQSSIINIDKTTCLSIDKYALLCAVTNLSSSVLVLLDITCISAIVGNSEVLADYKVGSAIPNACMFIPACLITFYYPVLVERYTTNKTAFRSFLKKVTCVFGGSSIIVSLVLFLFATPIIKIVYGEQYLSSVAIMRLLSVNYCISAGLRKLFGNVIAVFKKVSVNLYLSIVAGAINIVLDVWLIKQMGPKGAAIATLMVTIIITMMESAYIAYYLKNDTSKQNHL